MFELLTRALVAGIAGLAFSNAALAISDAEFKCQQNNDKAGGKYTAAVSKCASKCMDAFWKAKPGAVASDCYSPFGGATATCIDDPVLLKGANNKLILAIKKKCDPATKPTNECPSCYDAQGGGNGCDEDGYAGAHQQDLANQIAAFGPGVFCKTTGDIGTSATAKAEAKCQLNTAKNLAKLVGSLDKCFDKCFKNARKGIGATPDCFPAPVTPPDSATQACIGLAQTKAVAKVDKLCSDAGVALKCPPFCTSDAECDTSIGLGDGVCTDDNCSAGKASLTTYPPGFLWVNLVSSATAGNIGAIYCDD